MEDQSFKVDAAYKAAFNEGYLFAKELGLSKNDFKDLKAGNQRLAGIKAGIEQWYQDRQQALDKDLDPTKGLKELDIKAFSPPRPTKTISKAKDKGLDK